MLRSTFRPGMEILSTQCLNFHQLSVLGFAGEIVTYVNKVYVFSVEMRISRKASFSRCWNIVNMTCLQLKLFDVCGTVERTNRITNCMYNVKTMLNVLYVVV